MAYSATISENCDDTRKLRTFKKFLDRVLRFKKCASPRSAASISKSGFCEPEKIFFPCMSVQHFFPPPGNPSQN